MSYIDVTPDPAAATARATAGTSPTWQAWASNAAGTLRGTAASAKDSTVTNAFESYLGDLDPRMKSLAVLAERQGVNLGMAVQTSIGGDEQAALDQQGALSATTTQAPLVARPVNVVE